MPLILLPRPTFDVYPTAAPLFWVDDAGIDRTCFHLSKSAGAHLRHYVSPQIAQFVKICTFETNWDFGSSQGVHNPDRDPYEVRSNSSHTSPHRDRINASHSVIQELFESLPKLTNLTQIDFRGAVSNNARILQLGGIQRLGSLILRDCAIIGSNAEPLTIDSLQLQ
ncbi:hypothetical protein JAAARDRAFT_209533 [Jaapia argillacea MUCL 33604]|uniref:Uncharacterized protein n=1 Tax=Jaapia argillacea MUCL 33604 TaxID=933084 RepID=A0A067PJP1_9AGAM|nr:hypothetical protein JAAARDRAFT_209533 [Jaapia argillacea MUCL 33604]